MKKKISLVTMAKGEDYYLQEWIDYHLKLGFDDIFIYENNWRFKNKVDNDKVHFIDWDVDSLPVNDPPYNWNRHAICYSNFGKEYYKDYEWAAFFDVDCFLVLKQTDDVKEFISNYDNIPQQQVVINFAMFGDNGHKTFDENNTSVIERFTKRWGSAYNHTYYQFLPICKLHENFGRHCIHFVEGDWVDVDMRVGIGPAPIGRPISYDKAQLNHYYTKTIDEWKIKCKKTRAEGDSFSTPENSFDAHNFNDIDDFHALNFFKNKK